MGTHMAAKSIDETLARIEQRLNTIEEKLDALVPGVNKMDRHVDLVESVVGWGLGVCNDLQRRLEGAPPHPPPVAVD